LIYGGACAILIGDMLDTANLSAIRERHAAYAEARRKLIGLASEAQAASKRAIFALHRDDVTGADALLDAAKKALADAGALATKQHGLSDEGSLRAALEEYVEAALYRGWIKDGAVGPVDIAGADDEIYLGGLSDLTGELQRRQVRLATEGKLDDVRAIKDLIAAIVEAMLAMDLGGYLRNKFDQAKNSLRRAEDVHYDVTLRRG
jgi:predicted translin family RNA/ssDNA-binding protein